MQVKTDRTSSHTPRAFHPPLAELVYGTTFLYILTHAGITVENVTTNLPPVGNRTDEYGYCSSCPFKNMSLVTLQPCVYTVEVTRVFKGNYAVSNSSTSPINALFIICKHACINKIWTKSYGKNLVEGLVLQVACVTSMDLSNLCSMYPF